MRVISTEFLERFPSYRSSNLRCSAKAKRSGIRHNIYAGELNLEKCNVLTNNADRLYHYRITVSPPNNFLIKTPTIIEHDNHEYIFEGFSMFSHKPLENLPVCKVIRFNIEYTILYIKEKHPEHFIIKELDLFYDFLFKEILELVDLDFKAAGDSDGCSQFHFMPRFVRELPENGKELLSMNEVLNHLLISSKPLISMNNLKEIVNLSNYKWQNYVDDVKGMVVTYPGKKPCSLRVDQLDRDQRDAQPGELKVPEIVHFGIRPPQLSYAGNPEYQKAWREYVKFRHLLANMPKASFDDKRKLESKENKLQEMRTQSKMKRDVTIAISAEGFYRTGIMCDIVQHAMLIPVLVSHLRFHRSLDVLEADIKYIFKNRSLLQLALTHPSYRENFGTNPDHARNSLTNCSIRQPEYGDRRIHYLNTRKRGINTLINIMSRFGKKHETESNITHNERLEFLGDAVVEFVTSIHLFHLFPRLEEGGLATYRAAIVQNQHLAVLAKKLGLDGYMLYAHGSDLCHDLELRHAMANCFEALMGALFLDGGIDAADRVFGESLFKESSIHLKIWEEYPPHPLQEQEPNGDRQWIDKFQILQNLTKFEGSIGVQFTHIRLLARAFTDRSIGFTNLTLGSNQRLEFLGDTVLQLIASDYLYKYFPEHHEGHLSLLRSSLVNNRTQAVVCDDLGIGAYAIYATPKAELKTKDRADLLEAFLGALYVDKGLRHCEVFCNVCFFPRLHDFIMHQDWNDPKSKLQQCCLTLRTMEGGEPEIPIYKVIECMGPTNTRLYTVAVYFKGKRLAQATGHSIQQAEMNAAKEALDNSQKLFPQLDHQKRVIAKSIKQDPLSDKDNNKRGQNDGGERNRKAVRRLNTRERSASVRNSNSRESSASRLSKLRLDQVSTRARSQSSTSGRRMQFKSPGRREHSLSLTRHPGSKRSPTPAKKPSRSRSPSPARETSLSRRLSPSRPRSRTPPRPRNQSPLNEQGKLSNPHPHRVRIPSPLNEQTNSLNRQVPCPREPRRVSPLTRLQIPSPCRTRSRSPQRNQSKLRSPTPCRPRSSSPFKDQHKPQNPSPGRPRGPISPRKPSSRQVSVSPPSRKRIPSPLREAGKEGSRSLFKDPSPCNQTRPSPPEEQPRSSIPAIPSSPISSRKPSKQESLSPESRHRSPSPLRKRSKIRSQARRDPSPLREQGKQGLTSPPRGQSKLSLKHGTPRSSISPRKQNRQERLSPVSKSRNPSPSRRPGKLKSPLRTPSPGRQRSWSPDRKSGQKKSPSPAREFHYHSSSCNTKAGRPKRSPIQERLNSKSPRKPKKPTVPDEAGTSRRASEHQEESRTNQVTQRDMPTGSKPEDVKGERLPFIEQIRHESSSPLKYQHKPQNPRPGRPRSPISPRKPSSRHVSVSPPSRKRIPSPLREAGKVGSRSLLKDPSACNQTRQSPPEEQPYKPRSSIAAPPSSPISSRKPSKQESLSPESRHRSPSPLRKQSKIRSQARRDPSPLREQGKQRLTSPPREHSKLSPKHGTPRSSISPRKLNKQERLSPASKYRNTSPSRRPGKLKCPLRTPSPGRQRSRSPARKSGRKKSPSPARESHYHSSSRNTKAGRPKRSPIQERPNSKSPRKPKKPTVPDGAGTSHRASEHQEESRTNQVTQRDMPTGSKPKEVKGERIPTIEQIRHSTDKHKLDLRKRPRMDDSSPEKKYRKSGIARRKQRSKSRDRGSTINSLTEGLDKKALSYYGYPIDTRQKDSYHDEQQQKKLCYDRSLDDRSRKDSYHRQQKNADYYGYNKTIKDSYYDEKQRNLGDRTKTDSPRDQQQKKSPQKKRQRREPSDEGEIVSESSEDSRYS